MSANNIVILTGRLTRDVETKTFGDDKSVANFSIAVDGFRKDDPADFVDCAAFGKTAEIIAQYFGKGKPIQIVGRLKQESWDDKETGKKRSKLSVRVDSFSFLPKNSADDSQQSDAPVTRRDGRDQNQAAKASPPPAYDDGEAPF